MAAAVALGGQKGRPGAENAAEVCRWYLSTRSQRTAVQGRKVVAEELGIRDPDDFTGTWPCWPCVGGFSFGYGRPPTSAAVALDFIHYQSVDYMGRLLVARRTSLRPAGFAASALAGTLTDREFGGKTLS